MIKPKIALIPSGYKSGTVYSILPNNGDGDFDYERDGNATRVRKDGLIEELTVDDTPRLDWLNSDCPSLLLEPQRTNLQVYSEQFDNALWGKTNASVEANSIISPNGGLNADKLINTSTSNSYIYDSVSLSTLTDYSFSIFVKKGTANKIEVDVWDTSADIQGRVRFTFDTETISNAVGTASFDNYGNGWYRLKVSFTTSGSLGSTYFRIWRKDSNVINKYSYIFGAQLEQGSYCSSYIKTEDGSATRFADECNGSGNADLFNSVEGILYYEASYIDGSDYNSISISNVSGSEKIRIWFDGTNLVFANYVNNVNQTFISYPISKNINYKIAIRYKLNDFAMYVNGTKATNIIVDLGGVSPQNSYTKLNFNSGDIYNPFYGKVKDLRYYDTALTDAELTELTT